MCNDLFFGLQRSKFLECSLRSVGPFSAVKVDSRLGYLGDRASITAQVNLSLLKTSVAHPQTFSPAIKSSTMAAPLLFACQRQQCPYGTNVREHMKSHIMNEHQVKPWECAEAGCGVAYARA